MKNIIKGCVFFLCLLGCISCSQTTDKKEINTSQVININTRNLADFQISEIADFHSIIPLETTDESLIGKISKVFINDSLIVIFDDKINNILVFDTDGNYKYKIGKKGNAPGEYIMINDIYLNMEKGTVQLSDGITKLIQTYDLEGNFITSSKQLEHTFMAFHPFDQGYWGLIHYQDAKKNNLVLTDTELKIKERYFPKKEQLPFVPVNYFVENEKKEVFFHTPYDNTLYKITADAIQPFLTFLFDEKDIKVENIKDRKNPFVDTPLLHDVYLHGKHLLLNFSVPLENDKFMVYNVYLSMDNMHPIVFKTYTGFSKEVPVSPLPSIVDLSDGKLIFQIVPEMLPESLFGNFKNTSLKDLTSESNPVLVLYKLH